MKSGQLSLYLFILMFFILLLSFDLKSDFIKKEEVDLIQSLYERDIKYSFVTPKKIRILLPVDKFEKGFFDDLIQQISHKNPEIFVKNHNLLKNQFSIFGYQNEMDENLLIIETDL